MQLFLTLEINQRDANNLQNTTFYWIPSPEDDK